MPVSPQATPIRVTFLDNLRYFFVLCVVMEHACHAYDGLNWWPAVDAAFSLPVQFLAAFFDSFTMPLLFYVAGYCALPSIRKRDAGAFLKGKLKRLGIPWLVCILTVCPVLPLVYHYTRDGFTLTKSYWSLWLELIDNALRLDVGIVPSMSQLMANNGFYQRYMWFLSMLILIFFIFAGVYLLKKDWFDAGGAGLKPAKQGAWPTLKLFLMVGLATTVFSFVTVGLIMAFGPKGAGPEPLFTLGSIIQFRPSRLFFYLVYFGLGILTYRNNWIGRGKFPGNGATWLVLFPVLLTTFLVTNYLMMHGPDKFQHAFGAIYFLILNFLTMAELGFFMSLAHRYWNRPTSFDQDMASHSYNIYLAHYLFVISIQLILLSVPGLPGLFKFILVSALAVILSYAASRFLIKPHPRLSAAAAFGLLIVMFLLF